MTLNVDQNFGRMQRALTTLHRDDKTDMDNHHSFWDELGKSFTDFLKNPMGQAGLLVTLPVVGAGGVAFMTGFMLGSALDARHKAEQYLSDIQRLAGEEVQKCIDYWTDNLQEHAVASEQLKAAAKTWDDAQKKTMRDLVSGLKRLEDQDNGKGEWQEAYKKAIPGQRGAMVALQSMVRDTASVYLQGNKGFDHVYTYIDNEVKVVLDTMTGPAPGNEEDWGRRLTRARSEAQSLYKKLENAKTALDGMDKGVKSGQETVTTSTAQAKPFAAKQGGWPEAKGDTTALAPHA